jgi:hypothetical protein
MKNYFKLILLFILIIPNANAQLWNFSSCIIDGEEDSSVSRTSCNNQFNVLNTKRYGRIDFYVPNENENIKTIKINVNIFWDGSTGPISPPRSA